MTSLILVPLLPLAASLLILFFGRRMPLQGASLSILAVAGSFLISLKAYLTVLAGASVSVFAVPWLAIGPYEISAGVLLDGLSSVMLLVVTLVSLLVQIYSVGYMHGDPRFRRYFAYISFFTFSMLLLVLAPNFVQMFMGWELVGVSSYLLIGFWGDCPSGASPERKSQAARASSAGKKAFITTKVGDLGFFIGLLLIGGIFRTFDFGRIAESAVHYPPELLGLIGFLIFCGAIGKSAQFPLHVWLPDAMEGPTPVSALIHAATMVAAGVYLVARSYFLFQPSPALMNVVAWVGIFTSLFAGSMALVAVDIKRVLAFSTVSQLGYMMMALGAGGLAAGMFHLTTHAFFKALLFLGAGSVIHAMHTNDIREMGGLHRKMRWTSLTFLVAALAISGIWPFSGFYSKDEILMAVHHSGNMPMFALAVLVAGMTAFYMFRLWFLTFWGAPRDIHKQEHAHESPWTMVAPLVVLSILSVVSGKALWSFLRFEEMLGQSETMAHHVSWIPWAASAVSLFGIGLAASLYVFRIFSAESLARLLRPVHAVLWNKYWVDEIYEKTILSFTRMVSRAVYWIDFRIIDSILVDGVGIAAYVWSFINRWLDDTFVDGFVDSWGRLSQRLGAGVRTIQTGFVQNYLLLIASSAAAWALYKIAG